MSELKRKTILVLAIAEAFASNSKENVLHVTPDGNCFKEADKGHAAWHAKSTNQELVSVNKDEFKKEIDEYIAAKNEKDLEASKKLAQELADNEEAEEAALKAKEEQDAKDKKDAEDAALKAKEEQDAKDKQAAEDAALKAKDNAKKNK